MRIRAILNGEEKIFVSPKSLIVVGRPNAEKGVAVDLDLTPDMTVSRPHARIGIEDGEYWIEDPRAPAAPRSTIPRSRDAERFR